MTFSDWEASVKPKVKGTWNLHRALSTSSLDFFLLFSSICGITGQWGQANYNSANSFLDAFVKYRHGQNLNASVVDIGFMGGVGMATENAALVKNLKKSGYYFLSESELIDALAISILHSRPGDKKSHFALGITTTKPINASSCRPAWKKDARMSEAHQFMPPQVPNVSDVEALLKMMRLPMSQNKIFYIYWVTSHQQGWKTKFVFSNKLPFQMRGTDLDKYIGVFNSDGNAMNAPLYLLHGAQLFTTISQQIHFLLITIKCLYLAVNCCFETRSSVRTLMMSATNGPIPFMGIVPYHHLRHSFGVG